MSPEDKGGTCGVKNDAPSSPSQLRILYTRWLWLARGSLEQAAGSCYTPAIENAPVSPFFRPEAAWEFSRGVQTEAKRSSRGFLFFQLALERRVTSLPSPSAGCQRRPRQTRARFCDSRRRRRPLKWKGEDIFLTSLSDRRSRHP